ncbi:hypothetical protein HanPSC8_Chr01g0009711 [Helianthus annuus]|nr:hypothetical protein HanHA89_Chr01g0008871 [Helianthus annuus]KAJ0782411.1 hypothetical protein HanLR1_Chr01g0007891 [Helianthus annuus]KAJ0956017.1 hypothetical protein HanPSC8_Chr01g0009711 [Helianthus annuus]
MGHHEGYMECASHVKAALKMKWDTSRCLVNVEVERLQAIFQVVRLSLPTDHGLGL